MANGIGGLLQLGKSFYTDPLEEARRCRKTCALFDFSFVHRATISGERALEVLHTFQTRELGSMQPGAICYTVRGDKITPGFAVKSDLTIWKTDAINYEVYSGRPQDIADLERLSRNKAVFQDLSSITNIFSVQGPGSLLALAQLCPTPELDELPYFGHHYTRLKGISCLAGRLGYTGEAGFELIVEGTQQAEQLWNLLAEVVAPAGMIAADMLRIEAGFILFLNDCRFDANAEELGLENFTQGNKTDGRYKLVCFQSSCDPDLLPYASNENQPEPEPGEIAVTSANRSQFTRDSLGFGFINASDPPLTKFIDPLGEFRNIRISARPFHDQGKKKPRNSWN